MQSAVGFISAPVSLICLARLIVPARMSQLMALDGTVAWVGLLVTLTALVMAFEWAKSLPVHFMLGFMGAGMLAIGLFGMYSPTLAGARLTYLPLLDIIILIESGIVMLLLGSEPRQMEVSDMWPALPIAFYHEALGMGKLATAK
ncbi:MAG: hypothetical protein JWN38_619 [Candidatus Saccharibacteria bacterium]|nr:hypothetical protein [Candidatus Saccharibacteria bacterium]